MEHLGLTGFCLVLRIKQMNESETNQIRAFIALSLPGHVQQVLEEIQVLLRSRGIKASWTKPGTFHLTLKFLGNVQALDSLVSAMNNSVKGFSSFQLSAGGMGVFPGIKKARVIWSGIGGRTDVLENIFNSLEYNLQALDIKRKNAGFLPTSPLEEVNPFFLQAN